MTAELSEPHAPVQVFPSPNGTSLVVGQTRDGEWIAEFRVRNADLDQELVDDMERLVLKYERPTLTIVR